MTRDPSPVAHGPGVCILREQDLLSGTPPRRAYAEAVASSLLAALDPSDPHDAQLLSALELWRCGDLT